MEKIIHSDIAEKLGKIAHFESLIDGSYLNDESKEAYKEIVEKFFPGKSEQAKLLNPGSYIMSVVYQWEKSFFGNPKTLYNIDWSDFIQTILITGEAKLKINVDTEELESIKPSNYYFDGKTEYFVKPFTRDDSNGDKENFVLLETFCDKVFLRKLFKVTGFDSIAYGNEVGLGYLEETEKLPSAATIDVERLVLTRKVGLENTQILETIINSIDRKIAHNDHTIMDYGDVWTIIKGINVDHAVDKETGVMDMSRLGKILVDNNQGKVDGVQPGVEIVKNTYDSIHASLKIIDSQLMQISGITGIPAFAFKGDIKTGNDSGTSKEKASVIFFKKIQLYQDVTKDIFNKFWDIIYKLPDEKKILEFQEIITTSTKETLEIEEKRIANEKSKLEIGLTTKEKAIMTVHGIGEDEAKIILKNVENDKLTEDTDTKTENQE